MDKEISRVMAEVVSRPATSKLAHFATLLKRFPGNSASAQRTRLELALRYSAVTTYEARKYLDCYYPPSRIFELRQSGLNILRQWIKQEADEPGSVHRIGQYVLIPKEVSNA